MNEPKKGLGRGLNALLGEAVRPDSGEEDRRDSVRDVEIARIRPNPAQPRQHFDEASMAELAESIRRHGVLQPILLRACRDPSAELGAGGYYELIAGERRWRAAQRAGLHIIPALVRDDDDGSSAELALIENVQREDLNAIEEAEGYQALISRFGHGQDEVAKLVGKSRSHVSNLLRLLALSETVRLMLMRGDISMGHARAVNAPEPEVLAVNRRKDAASPAEKSHSGPAGAGRDFARTSGTQPGTVMRPPQSSAAGRHARMKVQSAQARAIRSPALFILDQLDRSCQRLSCAAI